MGTLGETTSKNLAAIIRGANYGAGHVPKAAAKYHGSGGGGGTWGKAPTGRGESQHPVADKTSGRQGATSGRRDRVRPNSEGTKSLWDTVPAQSLPKAPPKGGRPGSPMQATKRPEFLSRTAVTPVECQMSNLGLTAVRPASPATVSGTAHTFTDPYATRRPPSRGPRSHDAILSALSTGFTDQALPQFPPAAEGIPGSPHRKPVFADITSTSPINNGDGAVLAEDVPVKRLQQLEDSIKAALKKKRTVYSNEHALLDQAFQKIDDGSGDIDASGLQQLFANFGVTISTAEATALFKRHKCGTHTMPYVTLSKLALSDQSRQLAADLPTRKGAYAAGDAAAGHVECKIVYRPCKTPVYTPSGWHEPGVGDAAIAASSSVPDSRLALEFVYGYDGVANGATNVFYNCQRQVVYYTAGIAVVYTPPKDHAGDELAAEGHTQHFFLGHDDDIKSLAVCPAAVTVDGTAYPAHSVFASGQVTSSDHGPYICVWDSRVGSQAGKPELRRLELPKSARGVCALGFSPDGALLTAVLMDNVHTVYVYDWRTARMVGQGRGYAGEPPSVYGVTWNPHVLDKNQQSFVTWGKKHVKCWTRQPAAARKPPTWAATQLSFGRFDLQNVHSAAFLPVGHALAVGLARGEVLVFEGTQAVRSIAAHSAGPQSIAPDGSLSHSGVRGMALHENNTLLLTAGANGVIQRWRVEDGELSEERRLEPLPLTPVYGPACKPPVVRGLAVSPHDEDIVVGTATCNVIEVNPKTKQQETLVYGHAGSVHAVAWHPTRLTVFATAADTPRVLVFDAACRDVVKTGALAYALRAVAWSPAPVATERSHHLAVGGAKGALAVLDEETLRLCWESREACAHGVTDLKYSPRGDVLAVATADRHVDLYSVSAQRYTRAARCVGHSAVVRHVDWSVDSRVLRSSCSAYETLVWSGRSGKQLTANQRDTAWATWTSALGFPVMGIWPDAADGTDVNAVARHPGGALVATADDGGLVKLFNFPCVVHDAPHRAYLGHSAHVLCVRFSDDGTWLASCGGADHSVFQFRVVALEPPAPPEPEAPAAVWGSSDGVNFGWTVPVAAAEAADTAGALDDIAEVSDGSDLDADDGTGGW